MGNDLLFVCLGNSCRSIMAEALARNQFGDYVQVASAGLSPLGYVAQGTVQVLEEAGISSQGLYSKGFEEVDLQRVRLIVHLAAESLEGRLPSGFSGHVIHRPLKDPYGESLEVYRAVRDEIRAMLQDEMPRWLADLSDAKREPSPTQNERR